MRRDRLRSEPAFTLVELLLAAVITALVVAGTAFTLSIAGRSSRSGGGLAQLEAAIDEDLAAIEDFNKRYSCCSGSCTADASVINASSDCARPSPPTNENLDYYYAPCQTSGDPTDPCPAPPPAANRAPVRLDTTAMQRFRDACAAGTITTNFIAAFPAVPQFASPPAPPNPPYVLSRSALVQADAEAHRLQWTYTGTRDNAVVVTRVVDLVPTAAHWCP